ncbi:ABC transporter permease subunit [Roseomonas sp. HJA6]|uniref:ABC transporter permease subunit n=1 Tax=Roseomonas alba TaxID=2846776 RepID=A0ABS7AF15_9PROT|nr:ABC transporter permease subunit [Neoroseomonas alba]MBW6400901.1 ABC transporter permease subunit [Neoroseomonas alba]
MGRLAVLAPVWVWLLVFVAAPAGILLAIALAEADSGLPPFRLAWSLAGFATLTQDAYYLDALLAALRIAAMTAGGCLLLAYPMAMGIARAVPGRRVLLLAALMLPFWTGFLLRVGAWIGLLRDEGWINGLLMGLGITDEPLPLLYTEGAMLIGMIHAYLPFAVLPLFAALLRLDPTLGEAAADLGARPATIFFTVTLPVTLPAAAAAFLLVFIPAAGEFVIPELMGPPEAQLVGRVLWQEFFQNRDWPVAAALAVTLLVLLLIPIRLFQRLEARG